MPKIIQIEVPEEFAEIIEKNSELKNKFVSKVVESIAKEFIEKGKIAKQILDYLAKEEDVILENEEEILKEIKKKERERVKCL
jgi:hypothetical protein